MKSCPLKIICTTIIYCFSHYLIQAQAYTLYGILGNFLVSIDHTTGLATEIAPLTPVYTDYTSLTYIPDIDDFFAVIDGSSDPRLVRIEKCTGVVTVIGYIDLATPALDLKLVEALAYNPDDSILYAAGSETPPPENYLSQRLMRVNPFTASANAYTIINASCQDEADDFAFASGAHFIMDDCPNPITISAINISTGVTTYKGATTSLDGSTLAIHPDSGLLYGVNQLNRQLYRISPATAQATLVGDTHAASDFEGQLLRHITFAPAMDTSLTANPASIEECDPGSGDAIFDLTSIASVVCTGTAPVNWYFDIAGTTPIPFPANMISETTTIYATISDVNDCESPTVPISLVVNPIPAASPVILEGCDQGNGQATFDLTTIESAINVNNSNINWYSDMNGTIPVTNPTNITTSNVTYFATVGIAPCESMPVPISLIVTPFTEALATSLELCEQGNGLAIFDLTTLETVVSGGNTSDHVHWYADWNGSIPISTPNDVTIGDTTFYATVGITPCESDPAPVSIIVNASPEAFPATMEACALGNGEAFLNASAVESTISGGSGTVNWYWDINEDISITDPSTIVSGNYTFYASVNNGVCESILVPIPFIVYANPVTNPATLGVCDHETGQELFDLTIVEHIVSSGSGNVNWYMDMDATIPITDPSTFLSSNTTIYALVSNVICHSPVVPVSLTIGLLNEDDDNNDIYDACEPCIPPSGLSDTVYIGTEVQISWLPPANSNTCQITVQSLTQSATLSQSLLAPEHDSWTIADSLLISGDSYQWNVSCSCTEDSIHVSELSSWEYFDYSCSAPDITTFDIDNCSSPLTISWDSVPGAERYEFYGETIDGSQQMNRIISSPGFAIPVSVPNGFQVLIRLREQCLAGLWSDWTPLTPYTIQCNAPALPSSIPGLDNEKNKERYVDNSMISLFPNPVRNHLTLAYYNEGVEKPRLEIIDILGNSIYARKLPDKTGFNEIELNLHECANGSYLIKLQIRDQLLIRRVIKM